MISTVEYQVATYSGEVKVYNVDPNDDAEVVIARARRQVTRNAGGSLPFGSQSWREVSRESDGEEGEK